MSSLNHPTIIRVLHVDDESDQRLITKMFLEKFDPELLVESASSGEEVLRLLKEQPFDVVVSDYQMPAMDGLQLCTLVNERSRHPFILYTGRGSEEVAERAYAYGAVAYVRKEMDPSHYRVLVNRIRAAVERRRAEEAERERVKELGCLYGISKLVEKADATIEEVLGDVVALIPPAWHYPAETCARITFDGRSYDSGGFRETPYVLSAGIKVQGEDVGSVVVFYLGEMSEGFGSPFLEEESSLLDAVAESLRRFIERKKMEEEIRSSEERLELLFDYAPDAIYLNDLKGNFIDGNKAAEKITGYKKDELIGQSFLKLNLLPLNQIPKAAKLLARNVLGQPTGPDELTLKQKDGGHVSVEISTFPVKVKDNTIVMGIARDITERKKIEEALSHERDLVQTLFEHHPDFIYFKDEKARFHRVSKRFSAFLGRSVNEIIGKTDLTLFPEEVAAKTHHEDLEIIKTGNPLINKEEYAAGVWVLTTKIPWFDEEGKIIGLFGISRDITERKHAEEMLRDYAKNLEKTVEEKSGELLDAERLVTAGKIASMVGHDLRGPLQTINNALYMIKNTPEKTEEAQQIAKKAVQRAAKMLEELRSQTRDTPLSLMPTDLSALIRATVEEAQIPESVNVALEAGDGKVDVPLDPLQMRRVLDNLIGNAVDAMPGGGVLRVAVDMGVDEVVVEVSDTGVGIPEDELSDLFKLFYTTKPNGIGLGLAYCKRTVEAHGGSITVDSKVGKGTTFTIKIPLPARS